MLLKKIMRNFNISKRLKLKSYIIILALLTFLTLLIWQIFGDTKEDRHTASEVTSHVSRDSNVAFAVSNCLFSRCNTGRLGNQMFTYAVLFGLSKLNNRTACATTCLSKWFEKVFKISAPKNFDPNVNNQNEFEIGYYLNRDHDSKIPRTTNLLTGANHPESYTFFDFVRSEIRKEFTFKDHLVQHAQNLLKRAALKGPQTVFVGVHVRKVDVQFYHSVFNTRDAGVDFYKKAMDIFRRRFPSAVFVVTSNDMDWCRSNLADSDVFIHKEKVSAEHDLALLAHCNHSIFSRSTFGFWGAYLAGGQTIYLVNVIAPGTWLDLRVPENTFYLPDWLGIETNATYWKNYEENKVFGKVFQAVNPILEELENFE